VIYNELMGSPRAISPWPTGYEPVHGYTQRIATFVGEHMEEAQIIRCDDVTHFYYEGSDKDRWFLREDFPNLVRASLHQLAGGGAGDVGRVAHVRVGRVLLGSQPILNA
jgi:hypothetical protein